MKALPIKHKLIPAILAFFEMFRPGDKVKSEDIVKFCKRRLQIKYIYSDTVLKYARNLRKEGRVNYTVTCKATRDIEILEPGEPHSI